MLTAAPYAFDPARRSSPVLHCAEGTDESAAAPSSQHEAPWAPRGGSMSFHPYLFFGGDCRQAFTRYQEVFGGELVLLTTADLPESDRMPGAPADFIMH